jgi:hypothetical protein
MLLARERRVVTLVPFTGWMCVQTGCGKVTSAREPRWDCCPRPLPLRVLVDVPEQQPVLTSYHPARGGQGE